MKINTSWEYYSNKIYNEEIELFYLKMEGDESAIFLIK